MWGSLLLLAAAAAVAESAGAGAARLVCYVQGARATDLHECTHIVYAGDARGDKLDGILKEYRKYNPRVKIVLRVAEVDKDLRTLLKSKHVQGLELHDVHKTLNRTKALEAVEAARTALTSSGGGPLFLSLPTHPELLAKYYDLRMLMKKVDLMVVETHNLGAEKKMTYHPSRLSGLWDMMNTDSVVDLVVGLGVPSSKIVITLPASAQQFQLQNETLSTPGSPTVEDSPKEIGQAELCRLLQKGRWTLERDQDLSAPYAFKDKTWIAFEDSSSVDVKGKYARVRGLAGLALYRAERDEETPCGPTLRTALDKVLNQQSRAPRAAVLRSLEQEILSAPQHRALDALQVSPYRITQVVDSDGLIHSIREDTRTEFSCSRQGYFVHPRSCARFYRCVKFDQLSPEYTVFEFDCPAGLAFDSRYEVCVWPGSLADSQACPGSSEIAPVPRTRFICPEHEGYYADPENCRWFFACLDHGKAPLTAYEFRCPFGLGFDAAQLKCDWPWLVPGCGNIARYEAEAHGFAAHTLTGAVGFHGQTAEAVNIAAHQSLASGAALDNLVGLQGGFLSNHDALDSNFITSQELANGQYQDLSHGSNYLSQASQGSLGLQGSGLELGNAFDTSNIGLVQPTNYNDEKKYTSGSLILDDYRLPTKKTQVGALNGNTQGVFQGSVLGSSGLNTFAGEASKFAGVGAYSTSNDQTATAYSTSFSSNLAQNGYQSYSDADNSGAYVHDPSGDYAEPYRHDDSPVVPYKHDDSPAVPYIHDSSNYKASSDYYDYNRYKGTSQSEYEGKYVDNSGQYVEDNSGAYVDSSAEYKSANGAYDASSNYKATSSSYRTDSSSNSGYTYNSYNGASQINEGQYAEDNSGQYVKDNSGAYVESSAGYKAGSNGYRADYSGSNKQENSGQYVAGVYRADGHIGSGNTQATSNVDIQSYSQANAGNYISDSKAYTGSSHTLTAGAINVGLVGKTTLVDASYADQGRYQGQTGYTQSVSHSLHPGHVAFVSQPAVSINHIGTDENNLDGYQFVTTPTSSGVPTTATPFAITTALPAVTTYKTTFVPEAPKSTIKQIFGYSQPAVTYVQPSVVAVKQQYVTPKVEVAYNQGLNYNYENKDYSSSQKSSTYNSGVKSESSGYDYSKPSVKFEDGVSYTTAAPAVVSTYKPQGFAHSQQTLHTVETSGFDYSTAVPVTEVPFKKAFAYTTGPAVTTFAPTVSTYSPQAFSQQTIHKVEASNVELGGYSSGVSYEAPKTVIQYTTPQPVISVQPVVSTYQPQVFSQQTLHQVDGKRVNTYSQDSGYKYEKPAVKFEDTAKTAFTYSTQAPIVVQYSTPAPAVVSTYQPQVYSHQTLHRFESKPLVTVSSTPLPEIQYEYQSTPVTVYQNPLIKYTQPKVTPITYVQPTYRPQAISHQTIHKIENGNTYSSGDVNYELTKSVEYQQPQTVIQYTTPQPPLAVQSVVSTYQPQVYSQQTLHKVDASQVNAYSETDSGYKYSKPATKFEETSKTVFTYSTPAPVVATYKPQEYSQQTIHKVENQKTLPVSSTVAPKFDLTYQTAGVSTYENPIIKYTQKITPLTYVKPTATVFTQTYQPIVQQHEVSHVQTGQYEAQQSYEQKSQLNQEAYSYNQPEIQRNVETAAKTYSDASVVSQQYFHLSHDQSESNVGKDVVFVSTTPSTLAYEEHYSEEAPKVETYKAPEYIPPKTEYQSYSVVSSAAPIVQESYIQTQEQYVKPVEHSQQYETVQNTAQQVSYSTSHVSEPKRIESYHILSFPGTKVTTKYQQATYDNPEIQVGYKAEEYLPPVVSTQAPVVTTTYRPRTYSTTRTYLPPTSAASTTKEYIPPAEPEYNAPEYLPPSSTYRPRVKSTTPTYKFTESTTAYKAAEYLPPAEQNVNVVNFESFGFDNIEATAAPRIRYNPYQEISVSQEVTAKPVNRRPNLVVETAKSNLLGFGTVGPDAGLVSPVTYTTAAPVVSSTYAYRPIVKSTTQAPLYVESTTYKAPEYLPPSDESEFNIESYRVKNAQQSSRGRYHSQSTSGQVQRKQNIVVQTAKASQLAFNSGSEDLVSQTYTASTPVVVSTSETYTVAPKRITTTYAPEEQGIFEVSPPPAPRRRVKPKVAVVTKINDFNPLLVRKLGAVCSCQSPVLVLKGKRPSVPVPQDFDDYTNEYDDASRGDINDDEWAQKTGRIQPPTVTTTPIVTSTVNPIIVPDDSYYQDYQEPSNIEIAVTPKAQIVVSSTPVVTSTQRLVRIRPRVKAVTVAPTYKTVLLNQEVAPTGSYESANAEVSAIDSQSFDRYGPGGWRSRDETLQGSVDCKRAGLFRHPKQCNKFYACRWDCTKQRFTLHVFNCPVQLSFDPSIGACNWPSQGPACQGDTLLTNAL